MHTTEASGIFIRPLKLWELPKLIEFKNKNDYNTPAEKKSANRESLLHALAKALWNGERMATLVAVRDDEILGYASLVFGKGRKFKGNAYLVSTAVKALERSKGIGSKLLSASEDFARSRQAKRIELEVFASNERAINLYKRVGYEVEGTKRRVVETEDGFDDLIFMAKFL